MLATAVLTFASCLTFAFGTEMSVGVNRTTTGHPRNCQDLILEGKLYEGHYVVYLEAEAPERASMIYCSQHNGMKPWPSDSVNHTAKNCLDLLQQQDGVTTGPYIIYPYTDHPVDPVLVLCDQDTYGGGWTVIQHRFDGSEEFYRPWIEYLEGFGNVAEEHYLGNNKIVALTGQCVNELRVELQSWNGSKFYAHYDSFHIDPRFDYQLQVFNYVGNAGDSLMHYHNGKPFSTYDVDHDTSSSNNNAEVHHGAWWYGSWGHSNLNGRYYPKDNCTSKQDGIVWYYDLNWDSLKTTKMMVRPFF